MDGALFINKNDGISSFGVIDLLKKQFLTANPQIRPRDLIKLGHGGTLDPFATGLLIVLCGRAVKLARYFLGATKSYEGIIRFGETTVSGDPTGPVSETSAVLPSSLADLQDIAHRLTLQPYLQTPPMHSAKKLNGKPLYELARAGIEVEREPKLCHLYQFEILNYEAGRAKFRLKCSSGTYVRTLAQDLARFCGSVALLDSLHRTSSGVFDVANAWTVEQIDQAVLKEGLKWDQLPCWMPFDRLLDGYSRAEATEMEWISLTRGQQQVLPNIVSRIRPPKDRSSEKEDCVAIYSRNALIAIARKEARGWEIERVFTENS